MRKSQDAIFSEALERNRGKIHIDLGANLGLYTKLLSQAGSRVFAFEPDPWTAARLRENLQGYENVEVIEAAAGTADSSATMYRRIGYADDPAGKSDGTSLLADKLNVDPMNAIEVRCIDLLTFLDRIEGEIGIVKIDIEGAEVALLNALLDWNGLSRLSAVFVETHESRIPQQREEVDRLWRRTRRMKRPQVSLDWA